ncbi:MAG: amylo-alpha-1,6-glucosidase [Armatimonadota bacterium]
MTGSPLVRFGREVCGDLRAALRREWLVTNGLGGYASGTLAGINTRRYHGLLVAALAPPVERTVLVGGLVEWVSYDGRRYPLSTHQYGDGTIDAHGHQHMQAFALDGLLPTWTFALGDALLERRVWMEYRANTTYVMYHMVRGSRAAELEITPLVTYRDFHALSSGHGWKPRVEMQPRGALVRAFEGARPFSVASSDGEFVERGHWYWNFLHREETARGLDDRSDLYAPGAFTCALDPGDSLTLTLTCGADADPDGARALIRAQDRQRQLVKQAAADEADPIVRQLVLAADQFIVSRQTGDAQSGVGGTGKTVIAGYHWFNDWGRDTMIALPGLTLATGRAQDAADIIRAFVPYVVEGLLPNNFPDRPNADPGYNTVDASLWYVLAVRAYDEATHDEQLVADVLPVLREIADRHIRGTRYGIGVDPADGLLRAGEPGLQLTWMDAKVGNWVVTPRIGKPVEINALWFNSLRTIAGLLSARRDDEAQRYHALADGVRTAFRSRFVRPGLSHLADVVDGPDGDDLSMRPNQILAVSLPFPLLDESEAASVVESVGRCMLTTHGLRSLDHNDPAYQGSYGGDQSHRDEAYHQGTVWAWLLGPFVEAYYRTHSDAAAALQLLAPIVDHLHNAGLGSISEIFEGDAPHAPRGCIAQAWSVAEILRVWRRLAPS